MKKALFALAIVFSAHGLGEQLPHHIDEGIARPVEGAPFVSGGPYTRCITMTEDGAALREFCDLISKKKAPSDDPLNYGRLRAILLRDSNLPVELFARPYSIFLSTDTHGDGYITMGDASTFPDQGQPNRTDDEIVNAKMGSWIRIHYSCQTGKIGPVSPELTLVEKSLAGLKPHLEMEKHYRSSQLTRPENALLHSLNAEKLMQFKYHPESISQIEKGEWLELLASVVRLDPKLRKDLRDIELKTHSFEDGVSYLFVLRGHDPNVRYGEVQVSVVKNSNEVRSLNYSRFQ